MRAARQVSGPKEQGERVSLSEWIVRSATEFVRLGISLSVWRSMTFDQVRVIQAERERLAGKNSRTIQEHMAQASSQGFRHFVRYAIPLES